MFNKEHLEDLVGEFGIDFKDEHSENLFEDAIRIIFKSYRKILKFDILNDTYETIKLQEGSNLPKLSEWLAAFILTGNVYYEDVNDLLDFMSPNNLKNYFTDSNSKKKIIRYRRLCTDGSFRWVALYVFPSSEFTKENQIVYLCIRDIQDDYDYQLSEQRKIAYLSTHDAITGCKNRLAFMNDINNLADMNINALIRVKRVDLETDDRITKIQNIQSIISSLKFQLKDLETTTYVINREEYVVLCKCLDKPTFINAYNSVKDRINDIALLGFSFFEEATTNLNKLMMEAEEIMYGEE